MKKSIFLISLIGLLLAQVSCEQTKTKNEDPTKVGMTKKGPITVATKPMKVLANWSQIVGNSISLKDTFPLQLMARFIVEGDNVDCQQFYLTPKATTGTPTKATAATTRSLPSDTAFSITVCQFEMFADWMEATLFQKNQSTALATFPGPYQVGRQHKDAIQAVGIGDTGCRASDCDADGGVNTKFKNVIQDVLKSTTNPDFVLHVGDFRYYNENSHPDSWHKWYMEFFRPAQPLLDLTPMAFIRGNHEECQGYEGYWYGERWYQFFEPTTSSIVASCVGNTASLGAPWFFDVAAKNTSSTKASWPHRIVMIDNSPDKKNFAPQYFDSVLEEMATNFKTALQYSQGRDSWWVMHQPLWNFPNKYSSKPSQQALLRALGDTTNMVNGLCDGTLCNPLAIMSGHAHMYQLVDFHKKNWPIQYVLGHGGVHTLNSGTDSSKTPYDFDAPKPYDRTIGPFKGWVSKIYHQNGFLIWNRNQNSAQFPSGWKTQNCMLNTNCVVVSP